MSTPLGPILSMWEAEGNRHAAAFDACAGAVVIGERPSVAAEVALGIARVQARRRRVAVADTVGELGPLEDLVPMDAPYGLIDSFFYGVSLNKIAYTVDPAKNLIIFPSGAVPIDHEALLGSDRWVKLLDGFRAADGLLLIVAPAESSALSSLIEVMDGVVLVGNVAAAPGTRVLAHARLPIIPARPTPPPCSRFNRRSRRCRAHRPTRARRRRRHVHRQRLRSRTFRYLLRHHVRAFTTRPARASRVDDHDREYDERDERRAAADRRPIDRSSTATSMTRAASETIAATAKSTPIRRGVACRRRTGWCTTVHTPAEGSTALVPPWARDEEFTGPSMPPTGSAKAISFWVAIVFGAFIAAALLTWITTSMLSRNDGTDSFAVKPDSVHPAARVIAAPAPTALAVRGRAARSATPVAAIGGERFRGDALLRRPRRCFQRHWRKRRARSSVEQGLPRRLVLALRARRRRTLLRRDLRRVPGLRRRRFPAPRGSRERYRTAAAAHVVRLPYAVLIQKGVSTDQASMFVRAYLSKGLPVYPLLQADGSASLWAGAFRTAEQAQPLVTSFRANGDQPTVTIRTGRSF